MKCMPSFIKIGGAVSEENGNKGQTFVVLYIGGLIDNFYFQCKGISRGADSQRFFIKVRDYPFELQVNLNEGIFHNKPLFDKTVGLSRRMNS